MLRKLTIPDWDRFLPLGLIGGGAAVTAVAFAADALKIGDLSGIGPNQVSVALSGFAVLLAGVVLMSPIGLRPVGEWLLIGVAVLAAAFAADLVVIHGLPEWPAKLAVMTSTVISILSLRAVPAAAWDGWRIRSWLRQVRLDRLRLGTLLGIVLQLSLVALVMRLFHLETQAVYHNVMLLAFWGFLVHYALPDRYRLPTFLLLSLAALAGILGLVNAAWLAGIGLGLIGLAHLRVSHNLRVVLLLMAGMALAAVRAGWLEASWLEVIWPLLASMFMFRMIIYMYDLKHGKAKPTLASTLSYFFLLPNVVFPFFPVVDYSTFRRTYYDDEQHVIYQRGLQWMARGVVHLLLYRFVNYYLVIAPEDVATTAELVRYLVSNFALYIRISGQFHLIIGLLHLFGFHLPETHHLYFLATSFTDLWRRINIYWKDFMMKVFYYPAYFWIRRWGATVGLVGATVFVFFLTWFLHAYQWFWLRGTFLLTAPDILFWSSLTVLVVAATLYEARRGRKRTLGRPAWSPKDIPGQALRAAAVFSVMAVLWALWSSESIRDWMDLMSVVQGNVADIGVLLLSFAAIAAVFALMLWMGVRADRPTRPSEKPSALLRTAAVTASPLLMLLLIGQPMVYGSLGGKAQAMISELTLSRLSDVEAALLQRGYYEDLVGVNRFNSQLWEIYNKRPSDWPMLTETPAARQTSDNLIVELVPSTTIEFHGARLSINRWGMRDGEYEQVPAPDTYRIALTGPSFVMGFGVADDEVFEQILENRLNREHAGERYARYEILNFAVPGYSAIQDLLLLEQRIVSFQPDALFFMAHQREEEAVVKYLADRLSVGAELPYPDLMDLARRAGVEAGMTKTEAERRLNPFGAEILAWTYRRIVEVSQAQGVLPVWIFMPTLEDPLHQEEVDHLSRLAEDSRFVVIDLSDAYAGQDVDSIVVAYWDRHPNAKGHRLTAERLYQALGEYAAVIPLFP